MTDTVEFDIETIPGPESLLPHFEATVEPPGQYKKPESIAEWKRTQGAEVARDRWLATSFDGAHGQICVIGVSVNGKDPKAFWSEDYREDEPVILHDFFEYLADHRVGASSVWVGHNISAFDLRFLFQRSVINNVRPPRCIPFNVSPHSDRVFDTQAQWAGRDRVKFDTLCKALGLPGKGSIDGSKVWGLVQAGRIAEVADYCLNGDVAQLRTVYERLTFYHPAKVFDFESLRETV